MVKDPTLLGKSNEELDDHFEVRRLILADAASIAFDQSIARAVKLVADMSEVSSAEVLASVRVSSAKISSSAQVHHAAVTASAERLRLVLQQAKMDGLDEDDPDYQIILSLVDQTQEEIENTSSKSIETINTIAESAIEGIKETTKSAISEINGINTRTKTEIDKSALLAVESLSRQKESPRTHDEIINNAKKAEEKVNVESKKASSKLHEIVYSAIQQIVAGSETAINEISENISAATKLIIASRDTAMDKVSGFLKRWRS